MWVLPQQVQPSTVSPPSHRYTRNIVLVRGMNRPVVDSLAVSLRNLSGQLGSVEDARGAGEDAASHAGGVGSPTCVRTHITRNRVCVNE